MCTDGLNVLAEWRTHVQHRERVALDLAALDSLITGSDAEEKRSAAAKVSPPS